MLALVRDNIQIEVLQRLADGSALAKKKLYHRVLKLDVRNPPVFASQSPETALQEIAPLILASAVLARLRVEAATQLKVPPQLLSFYKLKLATHPLWETCRSLLPQPVSSWPRKTDQPSYTGSVQIKLAPV